MFLNAIFELMDWKTQKKQWICCIDLLRAHFHKKKKTTNRNETNNVSRNASRTEIGHSQFLLTPFFFQSLKRKRTCPCTPNHSKRNAKTRRHTYTYTPGPPYVPAHPFLTRAASICAVCTGRVRTLGFVLTLEQDEVLSFARELLMREWMQRYLRLPSCISPLRSFRHSPLLGETFPSPWSFADASFVATRHFKIIRS